VRRIYIIRHGIYQNANRYLRYTAGLLLCLLVCGWLHSQASKPAPGVIEPASVVNGQGIQKWFGPTFQGYFSGWGRTILDQGLPLAALRILQETTTADRDAFWSACYRFTQINPGDPRTYLEAQLPFLKSDAALGTGATLALQETLPTPTTVAPLSPAPAPEENITTTVPMGAPRVLIYTTHNAETYLPTDGTAKLEGKNAGVAQAASTLAETLEQQYQIKTIYNQTIHDYPQFEDSYGNSAKTVRQVLAQCATIEVVIDVHRDAGLGTSLVTMVGKQRVAKMLLVVGSDSRLSHPGWKNNWEYAKKIVAIADKVYPDLFRGVRIQQGRYNQHLHPHAILVEVGTTHNSLEEAREAMRCLAEVLNEILNGAAAKNKID
jgi:stage II sporulation protein P